MLYPWFRKKISVLPWRKNIAMSWMPTQDSATYTRSDSLKTTSVHGNVLYLMDKSLMWISVYFHVNTNLQHIQVHVHSSSYILRREKKNIYNLSSELQSWYKSVLTICLFKVFSQCSNLNVSFIIHLWMWASELVVVDGQFSEITLRQKLFFFLVSLSWTNSVLYCDLTNT